MAPSVALLLFYTHAKMPTFALLDAERCESGRIDMLGKHASRQRDRGFESHPLRHTRTSCVPAVPYYVGSFVRANGHTSSADCLKWIQIREQGLGPVQ